MNILNSLFGLVKYNGGQFKSTKQAAFLSKFAVEGVIYQQQNFAFGEFNGCTRLINWQFFISDKGIEKVLKISKGGLKCETYWENTPECKAAVSASNSMKLIKKQAAHNMNRCRDRWFKNHDKLESIAVKLNSEKFAYIMSFTPDQVAENKAEIMATVAAFDSKIKKVATIQENIKTRFHKKADQFDKLISSK